MQLSGTVFGVVVMHIKPQLEKLLRLPMDSLSKEIKLNQDLMKLFIKYGFAVCIVILLPTISYNIPSDLVSYAGSSEAPEATKIAQVIEHVRGMQQMVDVCQNEIELDLVP